MPKQACSRFSNPRVVGGKENNGRLQLQSPSALAFQIGTALALQRGPTLARRAWAGLAFLPDRQSDSVSDTESRQRCQNGFHVFHEFVIMPIGGGGLSGPGTEVNRGRARWGGVAGQTGID